MTAFFWCTRSFSLTRPVERHSDAHPSMRTGPPGHRGQEGKNTKNKYLNCGLEWLRYSLVVEWGADLSAGRADGEPLSPPPGLAPSTNPVRYFPAGSLTFQDSPLSRLIL